MANVAIFLSDLKTGRCSSTVQVRLLRFWEARNVRRGGELMGVDILLLDSQYRQRSAAEDAILDISHEFDLVEQRLMIETLAKAHAALRPSRYVLCIFRPWVFCKYSSTQQHHELRIYRNSARNMEDLDSTLRLKASFNL
ncbi:hypothetical protein F2Q70_00017038 [Brassica cretica]|uniref:Uncharacterized protein n=1 Tax=Brassica cretica TaxID=69181 RepID=A0A8S9I5J5_BRACR|nr:hypothetical protein F2Q70_00017038 [Brassica cretica]KAF2599673.1 hypothetical protein F2Q68_00009986 [Brassica cretica]